MKKINFCFILLILFINSCDYKPIYSNKDINFSIKQINTKNNNALTNKLRNSLKIYSKNLEIGKNYTLNIESLKNKKITSKDTMGNAKTHSIEIIIKLEAIDKERIVGKKKFIEIFNYSTQSNKFNLSQYEKNIEENLINKISENIGMYLSSI